MKFNRFILKFLPILTLSWIGASLSNATPTLLDVPSQRAWLNVVLAGLPSTEVKPTPQNWLLQRLQGAPSYSVSSEENINRINKLSVDQNIKNELATLNSSIYQIEVEWDDISNNQSATMLEKFNGLNKSRFLTAMENAQKRLDEKLRASNPELAHSAQKALEEIAAVNSKKIRALAQENSSPKTELLTELDKEVTKRLKEQPILLSCFHADLEMTNYAILHLSGTPTLDNLDGKLSQTMALLSQIEDEVTNLLKRRAVTLGEASEDSSFTEYPTGITDSSDGLPRSNADLYDVDFDGVDSGKSNRRSSMARVFDSPPQTIQ